MARAHRVALILTIVATSYLLCLFGVLSVPLVDPKVSEQILPVLPWWLLVAFGSYSLWSIGMGLFTVRECPEAYDELLRVSVSPSPFFFDTRRSHFSFGDPSQNLKKDVIRIFYTEVLSIIRLFSFNSTNYLSLALQSSRPGILTM